MTTHALYSLTGLVLVGMGLLVALTSSDPLRRVLALNVMGTGVASVSVATAYRGPDLSADPVLHAFVLTGIVVAVSTTAVALTLIDRIYARRVDHPDEEAP